MEPGLIIDEAFESELKRAKKKFNTSCFKINSWDDYGWPGLEIKWEKRDLWYFKRFLFHEISSVSGIASEILRKEFPDSTSIV